MSLLFSYKLYCEIYFFEYNFSVKATVGMCLCNETDSLFNVTIQGNYLIVEE